MKKFLLSCLMFGLANLCYSQNTVLRVYNGTNITIVVDGVTIRPLSSSCGTPTGTVVNTVLLPGASVYVQPVVTGATSGCVEWAAAKVRSLNASGGLLAIHPFFTSLGTSYLWGTWGFTTITDYWYPIPLTSSIQVLKIYPN